MRKQWLPILPFIAVLAAGYYLALLLIQDTGTGMFILLSVLPIYTFVIALLFGMRHGFHLLFPILSALAFLRAVPVFLNNSALVYVPAYGLVALVANIAGAAITRSGRVK